MYSFLFELNIVKIMYNLQWTALNFGVEMLWIFFFFYLYADFMWTSFAFGGATSTFSMENGPPGFQSMAALHLITWEKEYGGRKGNSLGLGVEKSCINDYLKVESNSSALKPKKKKKETIT